MLENNAATLNGKHTFYDYGLYVTNTNPVAPPEAKTQYVDVPGRNGEIDLTEALTGYTIYKNRIITLDLGGRKKKELWPSFMSDFLNEIHGKTVKVVFDDNPEYYYVGRAKVNDNFQRGNEVARFTVTIIAEPYKYSVLDSMDPWLWDPFSFVDGTIQSYSNLVVSGQLDARIIGSEMPVIPQFIVSNSMQVVFNGKTYSLAAGTNKIYDIVLLNKEYDITFIGNGTVSVSYRKGRL